MDWGKAKNPLDTLLNTVLGEFRDLLEVLLALGDETK